MRRTLARLADWMRGEWSISELRIDGYFAVRSKGEKGQPTNGAPDCEMYEGGVFTELYGVAVRGGLVVAHAMQRRDVDLEYKYLNMEYSLSRFFGFCADTGVDVTSRFLCKDCRGSSSSQRVLEQA